MPLLLVALSGASLSAAPASAQDNFSEAFSQADIVLQRAVSDHEIPGAVLVVGHAGKVVHRRAFGSRALEPHQEPMTPDTIFDLASLTKPFTATCVMRLVERGQVRLNDPVARYIPEFARNGKQEITVRQLLTHFSGLPADLELKPSWSGYAHALQLAYDAQPAIPPGSGFLYSDVNSIVLGELVARVSGMTLDKYATEYIFRPLKMETTRFNPPAEWRPRIAPTAHDEHGVMLRGVVDDPTARRMGGVAGHAGLFSTADDLARFAQALLDRDGSLLSSVSIEKMTTPQQPATSTVLRGLGWDIDSPLSTNRGELLPVGSFGHSGFTGTSIWIDPVTQTYIILLSNAIHPSGTNTEIVSLRTRVANAVAAELSLHMSGKDEQRWAAITGYNETLAGARRLQDRDGTVLAGIDVLEARGFDPLRHGRNSVRVGLLTNQTGMDSQGRRTIDVLSHAPGVSLVAIFSPEHGALGTLDTTEIGNTRDAATGIPIYSVYGATNAQRRPPMDALKQLDAVVIDLQDAGAPFFSYEVTMGYFLEAAAQAGIEVFVLDRPNPITGSFVQGPVVTHEPGSFKGYFPLPVRHGMTMGELANLFNRERAIHARLTVVAMEGWQRGDWYDATALAWINPSPNLRSLNEATLYPGVALVEGTNVSVGRGTDTPFEIVGAPWIAARQFADHLNRRHIAGVRFVPVRFTPVSGPYAGQICGGVNLLVTRRNGLDSPELGVELASALHQLYPKDFKIDRVNDILGNQAVFDAIKAGEDPRHIAQDWSEQLEAFGQLRNKYLFY
ncbi:MAG TPA: serine hydrolase [Terriglobales bacterium]|nr:serine hydrolase [Terriglobales bacterium]